MKDTITPAYLNKQSTAREDRNDTVEGHFDSITSAQSWRREKPTIMQSENKTMKT